ncbi:hypothetical protein FRB96_004218 [Tulasnella sp. 330]|nr:hypothetical protein FRB96_004218 [Tulasnella sp. 330]KAG8875636.1 hypothetical protein FRB97_004843 [Tulasnella sp. 331]KAG8880992.1 hypothetical protein FRB98_004599 [Tulasnella sp. 332]
MRLTEAAHAHNGPNLDLKLHAVDSTAALPRRSLLKTRASFVELERLLLSPGQLLFPGTPAYEKAIFIGNLLYRFITPAVVVVALSVSDVRETVLFARKYNIQLTVKGGGHSYAGYCLNEDGIVLDMRQMNGVKFDSENMIATLQAGAVWKEVYEQLKNEHIAHVVVGGQCPTVGVASFTLGGGLSPFSRSYGLGVDNLVEMTVVTADGEVVTLNDNESQPKRNRDLFWALRGGGGGNFAVTVEMKTKIHKIKDQKDAKVVCGELTWNLPQQDAEFKRMMEAFNTMDCPNELNIDAIWRRGQGNQLLGQMTVIYNGTAADSRTALAPLLECNPISNDLKAMHFTEWEVIEEGFDTLDKVYHHHVSFIFADKAITPEVTNKIVKLMEEFSELQTTISNENNATLCDAHILWDHAGGVTAEVPPEATAYFWRQGFYVMTFKAKWTKPELEKQMFGFAHHVSEELAPYAIQGKAAYLNYIDSTVEHWQQAYYGTNYERLREIKTDWDPTNFFRFQQSIEPLGVQSQPRMAKTTMQEWEQYQLTAPSWLSGAETENDVYASDAKIRREIYNF